GLMNNGTTGIITDKLGFTWVSTLTGLQRYNGYFLQTITPVVAKDTFKINFPVYFFSLNDGSIWMSFKQTVLQYNPTTNSFSVVISLTAATISPFNIVPLQQTGDSIWCMQENKGIVIYSRKGKLLQQFSAFKPSIINTVLNSPELLSQGKIAQAGNHIFINGNGGNFNYTSINKTRSSLLAINTREKKFEKIDLSDSSVLGLVASADKLCVLSNSKLSFIGIDNYKIIKAVLIKNITGENITSGALQFTAIDKLLLSINNHLFELDTAGNYRYELTGLNRNPIVNTGFIFQIFPDKFSRIWLRTNNDIKRIENLEIPFAHLIYPDEKNNFTRSVYYDRQKNIVIAGCFYTGIQLYDTLTHPLLKKTFTVPFIKNIISIEKLTNDEYLVITFDKGWFLFNLTNMSIRSFKIPPNLENMVEPTRMNFSNNIQRISKNVILIATANNVFRCVFSGACIKSAEPLLPDGPEYRTIIVGFLYDTYKNLWVGTYKGTLIRISPKGELYNFSLPGAYGVRCFAEDAQHHIWVGSDKGLYVYNNTGKLLKEFTIQTGLRNDCIYAMLPADTGSAVYASSNMGIAAVTLNGPVKNFTKEMGLQENEFNTNAACKSPEGKFYFGGINGITAFYPSSLIAVNDSPFLYVTRLVVNDSLYNSSAGIWTGDSVLLNYNQNRLRFDIAAIGLLNSNEYVYQYRLKGFEEAWQTTYQPIDINYTLDPGEYSLEITCHPILSSETIFFKKIIIIVSPPWWQTWWFRTGMLIVLVLFVAFLVHEYNHRKYAKKIQELETQNKIQQEKERISRDLHDHLGVQANAILYNTELLKQTERTSLPIVEDLYDTAKEMMLSLRETIWAMKKPDLSAVDLWFRVINFSKQMSRHYTKVLFSTEGDPPKNAVLLSVQALNLLRLIQEAVNNAVKHANAKNICIHSKILSGVWQITVEDDGEGFDFVAAKQKNDTNGLDNMQERAKNTGADLQITPQISRGTKITITLQV
ncbi:MAG: histidine kinase, partial [Chitinophagaceae bacterium]|nr:histidine kinase [Chitinophagaceae bacterium]